MAYLEGVLIYDRDNDRYRIRDFEKDILGDGLHCGQPLDVWVDGEWRPTRLEKGNKWYLIGQRGILLDGIKVRYQD